MNLTNHIGVIGSEAASRSRAGSPTTAHTQRSQGSYTSIPAVSRPLLNWFTWYSRHYIRRHFHSVRISRSGLPPATKLPLVIYSNHASWWDPLVGLVLKSEFFADRTLFAPIDAAMLGRYRMFAKLGFFGVEQHSRRGAVQFLRAAEAVLKSPQHLLAVTPQSRFADVRERPVRFEAGLGHLATRVERALFVPFVAEYVFWEERLPEILVRFGEPVEVRREHTSALTPDGWTQQFEQKLQAAQEALAIDSQRRDPTAFETLLSGGAGQGGIYDWWRTLKAKVRGEAFNREHGRK
jgi:1-acyl-sn-glycerol-3-phosphate acyltransferase